MDLDFKYFTFNFIYFFIYLSIYLSEKGLGLGWLTENKLKLAIFFFLKQINLLQNNAKKKLMLPQSIT